MPLPAFNQHGDLPPGVYPATLAEVIARFGTDTVQRRLVTERLRCVYDLAQATGELQRFVLFGSYVTVKASPNDIDIVLVMRDTFNVMKIDRQTRLLFDHQEADREFGASIFWTRPRLLLLETLEDFISHWQIKRDRTLRGIVELLA